MPAPNAAAGVPVVLAYVDANGNSVPIGPASPYRNLSLGVTGQVVKNAPGQPTGYYVANLGAATRFLKFYNKATAPDQTDVPLLTLPIPAGAAANADFPAGVGGFTAGISVRATTGVADADVGAPAANEVIVNLFYS